MPIIFSAWNAKRGLNRYFKLTGNTQFIEVVPLGPLPDLPREQLQKLLDQDFDLESWMAALPPENFLFRGVTITTLVDITIEEATKRLQLSLLTRQEIPEDTWMNNLQHELRNLFRLPHLRLGVATLQKNGELNFHYDRKIWNSLLIRDLDQSDRENLRHSIYHQAIKKGKTVIIENLGEMHRDPVASHLVRLGYLNLLLAPLIYDGQVVGVLELSNPEPGGVNGLSLFKIRQITPIFANALKRHVEEFENKVEAVMLEKFTAIHPAIQWKFREAAIAHIDQNGSRQVITFENLSPFFGSLDIRNSSKKRNRAIYMDLLENLKVAASILDKAV
ncbi:GAF domain-containing protein [Neolewinella litorea]|uniref:GAF domain-containing protein n=1 Tax=Neolewinella litorea TaxID=2562452 RepID=A0A4S4NS17_9BACT|nr:GAF domain-containing protein [Neolewinella litorea]THH41211.1 GAF domain-containing protein [Neolewinella litorea]